MKRMSDITLMAQCIADARKVEQAVIDELKKDESTDTRGALAGIPRADIVKELFRHRSETGRTYIEMEEPEPQPTKE